MELRPQWQELTPEALAALGVPDQAYVRPVTHEGKQGYSICSADGSVLAVAATRELAFATVRQNDMEPVDAH